MLSLEGHQMSRAASIALMMSLTGFVMACGTQEPTVIRIEESEGAPSTIPQIIPSPGVTPDAGASAQGSDAMGADTAAPKETEAPKDKIEVPVEKKETTEAPKTETPKTSGGTTAPAPSTQPALFFKVGRDGDFDNTAATIGKWLGESSLVCRVKNSSGALVTGTMVPSTGACFFDNNGEGYYATVYEYLAINSASTERPRWSFVSNGTIPTTAVATGTTNAGKPSFVCRVDFTDGSSLAGHVAPGYSGCVYSIDADVYVASNFYVLVK